MWPLKYEDRLREWFELRQSFDQSNLEQSLLTINKWWWRCPIINNSIQWDNYKKWPNPWELLVNDAHCDLARALGIVYTLLLIDESYKSRIGLVQSDSDNLVLVDQGKYILNWSPNDLLNIQSTNITQKKKLTGDLLYSLIGAKA
jgi:hypothetical protein